MKNKFISLALSVLVVLSTACDVKPVAVKPSTEYNLVVDGAKYRLVKEAYTDSENRHFVAVYEKEGETRCYYTFNITGKSMITLAK